MRTAKGQSPLESTWAPKGAVSGGTASWVWSAGGLLLVLAIAAVTIVLVGAAQPAQPGAGAAAGSGPRVGQLAPDFLLPALDGQPTSLAQFRGRPVMINFWATWCPPCKAEMPDIEQAYRKYQSRGLVVLGLDAQESPATVRTYLQDKGYSWTFLLDGDGRTTDLYRVTAFPTSVFLDRAGKVRAVRVGIMRAEQLEAGLSQILTE